MHELLTMAKIKKCFRMIQVDDDQIKLFEKTWGQSQQVGGKKITRGKINK